MTPLMLALGYLLWGLVFTGTVLFLVMLIDAAIRGGRKG